MTLKEFNKQEGVCPHCGSSESVVGLMDSDGYVNHSPFHIVWDDFSIGLISYLYIECECMKCHTRFNDLYKLHYAGQEPAEDRE